MQGIWALPCSARELSASVLFAVLFSIPFPFHFDSQLRFATHVAPRLQCRNTVRQRARHPSADERKYIHKHTHTHRTCRAEQCRTHSLRSFVVRSLAVSRALHLNVYASWIAVSRVRVAPNKQMVLLSQQQKVKQPRVDIFVWIFRIKSRRIKRTGFEWTNEEIFLLSFYRYFSWVFCGVKQRGEESEFSKEWHRFRCVSDAIVFCFVVVFFICLHSVNLL